MSRKLPCQEKKDVPKKKPNNKITMTRRILLKNILGSIWEVFSKIVLKNSF